MSLYLDDLEQLDGTMRAAYPKVDLQAGELDVDSVEDLHEVPPEALRDLTWYGFQGASSMFLHISRGSVSVQVRNCEAAHRVALVEIEEVMRRRRRRFATLTRKILFLPPLAGVAVGVTILFGEHWSFTDHWATYVAFLVFTAWSWYMNWTLTRQGLVTLERRRDRRSFWQRNSDALSVGLINGVVVAMIGAAAGALLTYLITK